MIKGEEGTPVTLRMYRPSIEDYITVDMVRRRVEVPSVSGKMLEDGIGYILIDSWDLQTCSQFMSSMEELTAQGMKGLIVDVRNNPGGVVKAACDVLDYFVEDGDRLVYTVDKNKQERDYVAQDGQDSDIPLTVLINSHSASSSEIFAGGIRDYKAGTLIGEKTYGKGIVQNVVNIGSDEAVKLTVAEYYLPSGVCIHGEGVKPDVDVTLEESLIGLSSIPEEEDTQLQKAVEILKEKMN